MDYIIIIIFVVIVAALIISSYSRGKHEPREMKPKGHENDPDYKGMEVRATEDQVQDIAAEQRLQGWALEAKETKPNTGMFGSDIWRLTFRRMTPEEEKARDEELQRAGGQAAASSEPRPIPAEPIPQTAPEGEDPFGMIPPAEEPPEEDPFGYLLPAPEEDALSQAPAPAPAEAEAEAEQEKQEQEEQGREQTPEGDVPEDGEPADAAE